MQIFLNKNPNSRYRPEAIEIISQLQTKLEKKAYENSKQYYKVGRFQSAVVALDNFTKDYPASIFAEEIAENVLETLRNSSPNVEFELRPCA